MIDLAAWHAEPLPADEAQARLARLRSATSWDERLEALRLRLLLGLPADMQRDVLLAETDDARQQAAVELVFGQAMLAQRKHGAWIWLDAAEKRLAHLMPGADYIQLMRRHASLRSLSLFERVKTPRPLHELRTIALCTQRLKTQKSRRTANRQDFRETPG
ncbi:MAG: hypothetical protein AB1717_07970 [Pseudomonadota bacterium]